MVQHSLRADNLDPSGLTVQNSGGCHCEALAPWQSRRRSRNVCPKALSYANGIGAGVGVLDTIACFLSILLLVLAESADLFDVHSTHILVGVAAVVVFGVAATVWLIRRLRRPAERSAR